MTTDTASPADAHEAEYLSLVARIQSGDPAADELLYTRFERGVRYFLLRRIGDDTEDVLHDVFLSVLKAVRRGDIRQPECLAGFVRQVASRKAMALISDRIHERETKVDTDPDTTLERTHSPTPNPERDAINAEKISLMHEALRQLSAKDREILTRFYLWEQSEVQIREEMGLTETQFRLLKSRAKARFGEKGKGIVKTGGLMSIVRRKGSHLAMAAGAL